MERIEKTYTVWYTNYSYSPTVMTNVSFEGVNMDIATPFANFYLSPWNTQMMLQSNGSITVTDGEQVRIGYSLNLYQEDSGHTQANLTVNYTLNNSGVTISRSIGQILKHSDVIKFSATRKSVSLIYGDTKLEMQYETVLSKSTTANFANLSYSTNATGKFIDYTFKY